MPLAVFLSLETNPEKAIVLALALIAISFTVLVALRDRWFFGASGGTSTELS
jgi:molybdate transport system permease protein